MMRLWLAVMAMLLVGPPLAEAQVQVRIGDPGRATYSELHEGLREGTPAADSMVSILRSKSPGWLWGRMRECARRSTEPEIGTPALSP